MTDNLELDELSESAVLDDEPILKKDVGMDDFDIPSSASDLEAVYDIPVKVSAILGKSKMKVSQLLKLNKGAIIELDSKVGEAIDIMSTTIWLPAARWLSLMTSWALP